MRKLAITVIAGGFVLASANGDSPAHADKLVELTSEITEAWAKSLTIFTNVAHETCCKVFSVSDPTNRMLHARAYAEAVLSLTKQKHDCNFAGLMSRMIACRYMTERLPDDMPLSLEFKWEIIARWWLQMKDEMVHFEAFGPRLPTIMYSGVMFSEEAQRKAIEEIETENKRRTRYDRQREYAQEIRGFMNGEYKFTYERRLMADCANLNNPRKDALLQMIIDAIGKVPKWYDDDLARRGLTYNLQTMSLKALDPDSIVSASGHAIRIKNSSKDDVKVGVDL